MSNPRHHSNTAQDSTSERECQARAEAFLVELIGERPEDLTWDSDHHLQGHVHVGRRELIVIATHDPSHAPVVLDAPTWDAVRHSDASERRCLIALGAITDHDRLVSVLAADEQGRQLVAA